MIFNILTIFPELISTFSDVGFIKRAISKNVIDINIVNIREYSDNITTTRRIRVQKSESGWRFRK